MSNKLRNNTAILLFTRSADDETVSKPLLPNAGLKENRKISSLLIESTIDTVRKTTLPFIIINSRQQVGATFGERFYHAFNSVFEQGFQNVIAIGNDCITLHSSDIIKAANVISINGGLVLGPATDGGIYLMGLNKNEFNKDIFLTILWETNKVFIQLQNKYTDSPDKIYLLSKKADIDTSKDLEYALNGKYICLKVLKRITVILNSVLAKVYSININPITSSWMGLNITLRGPPIFV